MKTRSWTALLIGFFALSCGGAVTPVGSPDANEEPPPISEDSRRADESAEGGDSPSVNRESRVEDESASGELGVENRSELDPDFEERGRYQLKLPVDSTFLQARLPERRAGRYSAWRQEARIWVGKSHLDHASFLDGGRLILAKSDADGLVRVYDRKSKRLGLQHQLDGPRFHTGEVLPWPAFSQMGSLLVDSSSAQFVVMSKSGVEVFDARSGAKVTRVSNNRVVAAQLSPDARIFVTETGGPQSASTLHFYHRPDRTQTNELGTLEFDSRVDAFALSRDNRYLALTYYKPQVLHVIDLHTGRDLLRIPAQDYVNSVAFSPNGRWVALGGQGLLLVDLLNPTRRAYYSHYYNNINTVAFSPSGDAIATSSYDGHIRLFRYGGAEPSLELIRTLRHDGRANVYRIQFSRDGNSLVSASGDRTVRIWGAPLPPTSRSPEHDEFRTLSEWTEIASQAEMTPREPLETSMRGGHYHPPSLREEARPSKIREGLYACKISEMYKLRDCTVRKTHEGHTMLEFHEGNLLHLKGVLYDDGGVVRYEAWQKSPSTIVGCDGCEQHPLHGVLRGGGNNFRGVLTFRNYHDPTRLPPLPPRDIKIEEADDRFPLTLTFRKPLPPRKQGHDSFDFPPVN